MNKAIFIDKDGTLIKDVPYNVKPELVFYAGFAIDALRLLQEEGYLLIIISNQSGIAKGYFTELELAILINKIRTDMALHGVDITGFYYCPHHPDTLLPEFDKKCTCRKPAAGMILQAAKDFNVDLSRSWMIGDILDDMEAGKRAGCKTILLNVGNETEWEINNYRVPNFYADNLIAAAQIILNDANSVTR
jgi:D-glycero-D-manno-heptose 1,7-bisphosphate phosphatase